MFKGKKGEVASRGTDAILKNPKRKQGPCVYIHFDN